MHEYGSAFAGLPRPRRCHPAARPAPHRPDAAQRERDRLARRHRPADGLPPSRQAQGDEAPRRRSRTSRARRGAQRGVRRRRPARLHDAAPLRSGGRLAEPPFPRRSAARGPERAQAPQEGRPPAGARAASSRRGMGPRAPRPPLPGIRSRRARGDVGSGRIRIDHQRDPSRRKLALPALPPLRRGAGMSRRERVELLEKLLGERVLVIDGPMGTALQDLHLSAADFGGPELEGCNENLNLVKPEVVRGIHRGYLEAGADILETNTFGGAPTVLAEYGLQERAVEINREAARLAREEAARFTDKPRFVAGSMGPTTKAISVMGGVTFEELISSYEAQAFGLFEVGVDSFP